MKWIVALLLLPLVCFGQAKHDANWVFPLNSGLKFENDTVIPFFSNCPGSEIAASFSSYDGELLFYLDWYGGLRDKNNEVIYTSTALDVISTAASGAFVIPGKEENTYYLFHMSFKPSCHLCFRALYSKIAYNSLADTFSYVFINEPVLDQFGISGILSNVFEGWTAVKHANGKDWWLLLKPRPNRGGCSDKFYSILFSDDKLLQLKESIAGTVYCDTINYPHLEFDVTSTGDRFSIALGIEEMVESFYFNRCNGDINADKILYNADESAMRPYSCEYSPNNNLLYVSMTTAFYSPQSRSCVLFQYSNLDSLQPTRIGIWHGPADFKINRLGQCELGPNGKLYQNYVSDRAAKRNYLSVVNYPDSIGSVCDFQLIGIELDSGGYYSNALPNFPNYNLGPLSIYQANAGRDTVYICADDADSTKVVYLGDSLPVAGVQYQWQGNGLNGDDSSRVLVQADTFGTYYLTLVDSSIQYSCQTRTDTLVVVPFYNCPTAVDNRTQKSEVRLWPNPFSGDVSIEMPARGQVLLYNLAGNREVKYEIEEGLNTVPLSKLNLASGMYIYKVWVNDELVRTDKLIKIY